MCVCVYMPGRVCSFENCLAVKITSFLNYFTPKGAVSHNVLYTINSSPLLVTKQVFMFLCALQVLLLLLLLLAIILRNLPIMSSAFKYKDLLFLPLKTYQDMQVILLGRPKTLRWEGRNCETVSCVCSCSQQT